LAFQIILYKSVASKTSAVFLYLISPMQEDHYTRSSSQYILYMWVVPALIFMGACALVYLITDYFNLSRSDRMMGFVFVLALVLYGRFMRSIKWLKRPEGGYYYLGGLTGSDSGSDRTFAEPAFYEKEFGYAWNEQLLDIGIGLFLAALSWTLLSKTTIILPLILFLGGLWFLLKSVKALRGGPVLKLAKEGIWTKESAFLPWSRIRNIKVTKEQVDDSVYHYLEIFLKSDDQDTFPDHKLLIDGLKDFEEIERLIALYKPRASRPR
ncbi:MAG: hypothetical protein O9353_07455, partial [Bacteroidia bacterium]|nr:hypothetical protein [Bacteroidia bacterium]